jgi:Fe-S oxidoreductase/nitrate reductase gamma subunit
LVFLLSSPLENPENGRNDSLLTSLDLFLISLVLVVLAFGLSRRIRVLRAGRPEECSGNWAYLLRYLFGHKKIVENPVPGTMHIIVFWGFLIPLIVVLFAQMSLTLPFFLSSVLSLILDVIGLLFLAATITFLIRRIRSDDSLGPRKSILPLIMLLFILITGFLAEGSRLSITDTNDIWASPAGWIISLCLPGSPVLMQLMIRIHFFSILLLVAITPFTFFRHLAAAPLNIFYKRKGPAGAFRVMPSSSGPPGANCVNDFTWKQLLDTEACVSCGRCEEKCPAFISGKPLSPRKIVRQVLDLAYSPNGTAITPLDFCITADEIWSCTTCMACLEACPVFVTPLDKIIDIRRHLVMGKGALPSEAATMIRDLEIYGDVNGKGPSYRADWALNREVRVAKPDERDVMILIWTGCSGSFHPRYQEVSRSLVKILKKAGVTFRILGKNELCCGDPARRLGEEELFLDLAKRNLKTLKRHNVKKIITLCPHCFNTLRNEYPKIEKEGYHEFEVIHAAQYIMELIRKKFIVPEYSLTKKITLHDPCYLGRANNIYEPLRDVINSVPGTSLTELDRSREEAFCCGAGGGEMWLHELLGKRINVIRSEEIVEKNVDVVCTACPYCQTMIDDGINGLELDDPPEVLDIIEIVEKALR